MTRGLGEKQRGAREKTNKNKTKTEPLGFGSVSFNKVTNEVFGTGISPAPPDYMRA